VGGNRELAERFIASLEARDWDAWAALLHPAVIYEIPQSRERIRGRDRYLRFNQEYPGDWHLRPKVTIADERHAVVWFEWLLDGRTDDAMAFFEIEGGLITRITDFWPEPYEPPPGREHLVERWLPAQDGAFPDGRQGVGELVQVGVAGVGRQREHAVLVHGDQGADGRAQALRVRVGGDRRRRINLRLAWAAPGARRLREISARVDPLGGTVRGHDGLEEP